MDYWQEIEIKEGFYAGQKGTVKREYLKPTPIKVFLMYVVKLANGDIVHVTIEEIKWSEEVMKTTPWQRFLTSIFS